MSMSKKKKIIGVVLFALLVVSFLLVYLFVIRTDTKQSVPGEIATYSDQTAKNLDQGTCGDAEYNELEAIYQKKLKEEDKIPAARVRLDQYACAVFNSNNDQALSLLNDAKKIYEQNNEQVRLDQVNSSIEFINARIERQKNPIQESTEDQEGGT